MRRPYRHQPSWRHAAVLATVLPFALQPLSAEPPSEEAADPIVAIYQSGRITLAEYRSWLAFHRLDDLTEHRREQLEALALNKTLAHALERSEEGIAESVRRTIAAGERQALARSLRRRAVEAATVSEDVVRKMVVELEDKRAKPAKVKLRNLFKRIPPGATDAERGVLRAELAALRKELLDGADFAALAKRASDSETRFRGGRMGVAAPGDLPPAIESVVFALAPGELSSIIEGPSGFTLFRCDAIIPAHTLSVEASTARIRQHLLRAAREEAWNVLRSDLLHAASPRYDLATARSVEGDGVVVRFAGGALLRSDLARGLRHLRQRPTISDLTDEQLTDQLERLVVERVAARRARKLGLDQEAALRDRRRWQRVESLAAEALRQEVERRFEPLGRTDLEATFAAHRDTFVEPERFQLRVVRLVAGEDGIAATFRRAEDLASAIRSGHRELAEVAGELSQHPSAEQGGVLGWLTKTQLSRFGRAFFETAITLAPNALGGPIRDGDIVWLIERLGHQPPRPLTFEEAEHRVRRLLGGEKTRALQQAIEREHLGALALHLVD